MIIHLLYSHNIFNMKGHFCWVTLFCLTIRFSMDFSIDVEISKLVYHSQGQPEASLFDGN